MDSLGGNTRTVMIANIGPFWNNYEETLTTLRYANEAKNIKNKPQINEDPKDAKLRQIQDEIKKLKEYLGKMNGGQLPADLKGLAQSLSSKHPAGMTEHKRRKLEELEAMKEKENREKCVLQAKIKKMQEKIIKGNEKKREYMDLQREVQRRQEEREKIKMQKLKIKEEAEEYELEKANLEQQFNSQKDELVGKQKMFSKLRERYEALKAQYDEKEDYFEQELVSLREESESQKMMCFRNERLLNSYFDNETLSRIRKALVLNPQTETFRLDEQCDQDIRDLCEMYVNIRQIQDINLETDIDAAEQNIILFCHPSPYVDFQC